jgi:hypothetical protein
MRAETRFSWIFAPDRSVELASPVFVTAAVLVAQAHLSPALPNHLLEANCLKLVFSKPAQINDPR